MILDLLSEPFSAPDCDILRRRLLDLADYWMNDRSWSAAFQFRRIVEEHRRAIPHDVGCCNPLLAIPPDCPWLTYVNQGTPLPLQWKSQGTGDLATHDSRLPPIMTELADQVCDVVQPDGGRFVLHFPTGNWPSLQEFGKLEHVGKFGFGSAFAALAVGLISAEQRLQPDPSVWTSADWQTDSLRGIDMLKEKMSAPAVKSQLRKFYVVPAQEQESRDIARDCGIPVDTVQVFNSAAGRKDVRQQLAPMLVDAALAPGVDSPFLDRLHYHDFIIPYDRGTATRYYDKALADEIALRCREKLDPTIQISDLITIATDRPEAIRVVLGSLRPQRVLILHTPDKEEAASDISKICEAFTVRSGETVKTSICSFEMCEDASDLVQNLGQQFSVHVKKFTENRPPQVVAFDIDRGLTLHKIALFQHVVEDDNLLFSIDHRTKAVRHSQQVIDHRSSRPIVWRFRRRPSAD